VCGGIAFSFEDVIEAELAQFLLPAELEAFRRAGRIESLFWGRRPILPLIPREGDDRRIHLYDWGNRDKAIDLPRTGWARWESVLAGRWKHLHPRDALIPARQGVEKGVWFDIAAGIEGMLVEKDGITRAYMITMPADDAYRALTGHDRMPKCLEGASRAEARDPD